MERYLDIQSFGDHAVITLHKDHLTQVAYDLKRVLDLAEKVHVDIPDATAVRRLTNLLQALQPYAKP